MRKTPSSRAAKVRTLSGVRGPPPLCVGSRVLPLAPLSLCSHRRRLGKLSCRVYSRVKREEDSSRERPVRPVLFFRDRAVL